MILKRCLDVGLAALGLIVMAPCMAAIALAIKLDSSGRVIHSRPRLGRNGRVFLHHKFRLCPEEDCLDDDEVALAGDGESTWLTRQLARSKLSDLPQLWNVIQGEMSLVGPRPEPPEHAHFYQGQFAPLLDHRPGIFGPNQLAFWREHEMYPPDQDPAAFYAAQLFPARARNDLAYLQQASLRKDLGWILVGLWHSMVGMVDWSRLLRRRGPHLAYDMTALLMSWTVAHLLRFEDFPAGGHEAVYLHGLWLLLVVLVPLMALMGVYRQSVRFLTLGTITRLVGASVAGHAVVAMLLSGLVYRQSSLMVYLISATVSIVLLVGARLYYREYWRRRGGGHRRSAKTVNRVLIYGAGRRGAALAELLQIGFPEAELVGFVDDSQREIPSRQIAGLPVLGAERDLSAVHAAHRIDQLWLSFDPELLKRKRLAVWCLEHEVNLIILPRTQPFSRLREPSQQGDAAPTRARVVATQDIPIPASYRS